MTNYNYPFKTVILCLSFIIGFDAYDFWKIQKKITHMESRLTKLEFRADKVCGG